MKRDLPHIAIALRRAREAARLSQYQLADISGVSRPTIAAIEMGSPRNVKSETILKLAQALNISTGELLGTSGHPDQHLERFLTSPMAEQLRVSKQEVEWLRTVCQAWPAGPMPSEGFFLLLSALRITRQNKTE
jgi:transcriptional regulator with XRE-family HTH domain